MGKAKNILSEGFIRSRVVSGNARGCWIWGGHVSGIGYGAARMNGKICSAHRLSWEAFNGPIPDGNLVLHKCDVPNCVNPEHLFLGTQADNVRDMVEKGRRVVRRGESHWKAKLTANNIIGIRFLYRLGYKQAAIAKSFGIQQGYVSKIIRRQVWTHV